MAFEAIIDPDPISEELAERVEMARWLQEAVASLPPKLCVVVHLHCFRQLTHAEIGRLLNMSEMTVKTYFSRSLPRLRKALACGLPLPRSVRTDYTSGNKKVVHLLLRLK